MLHNFDERKTVFILVTDKRFVLYSSGLTVGKIFVCLKRVCYKCYRSTSAVLSVLAYAYYGAWGLAHVYVL